MPAKGSTYPDLAKSLPDARKGPPRSSNRIAPLFLGKTRRGGL